MGRKLISLNFKPSDELPELEDLKTFLESDFRRSLAGFAVLETDAMWGDVVLPIVGKDAGGGLVILFPSVSRHERDYHDVTYGALFAGTWIEENRDEARRRYSGVDLNQPPRMLLIAPAGGNPSRAFVRTLERAGVEMMTYTLFDIETAEGPIRAVSFPAMGAPPPIPAPAPPRAAAPAYTAPSAPAPAPAPPPAPVAAPAYEPRRASAVDAFISSLPDVNIKAMSEQIMTFLLSRLPSSEGTVNGDKGFTLTVNREHLATIRLDRTALWLEVGPEKIPTNKIKDPATLERAMNLPSVLEALHSVNAK